MTTIGVVTAAIGPGEVRRRQRRRALGVGVVLTLGTLLVLCVSLSVGDFPVPLRDVPAAVVGSGPADAEFIVRTLRLPRALLAVLVGASFGAAGAVFQAITRNPLASPDIIGITAGATTVAVAAIVVFNAGQAEVSVASLLGAIGAASAILVLSRRGEVSPFRLVLVGIGLNAWLMAFTGYLLTRASVLDAQRATVWLTGSLNGRDWEDVRVMTLAFIVLFPALLGLRRQLSVLQLGDDAARGLGAAVERSRLSLILLAVALAAVGTAAAGPVAFVAFMSPTVARRLTRSPLAIVPSAMVGAFLLSLADLLARRLFAPVELPVGIVTGVVGAPYLLWLLVRASREGRGG